MIKQIYGFMVICGGLKRYAEVGAVFTSHVGLCPPVFPNRLPKCVLDNVEGLLTNNISASQ